MEKLAAAEKITRESKPSRLPPRRADLRERTPDSQPSGLTDDAAIFAEAFEGFGPKEAAYELQVSKTYFYDMQGGLKPNPIGRTRKICALLHARGQGDRIPAILHYIAANFNVTILDAEQTEAFKKSWEVAMAVKVYAEITCDRGYCLENLVVTISDPRKYLDEIEAKLDAAGWATQEDGEYCESHKYDPFVRTA